MNTTTTPEIITDFRIHYGGSVSLFVPLTEDAQAWLDEHCSRDGEHQYLGRNLAVEARYLGDLIQYAINYGLTPAPYNNEHPRTLP